MKKILILLLLISSIASAQGDRYRPVFKLVGMEVAYWAPIPRYTNISARYKWIATAVDSGLHIPQYNGVPSGVRVGNWEADGAIAMDTLNGYFYCYSGGVWIKMAKFSDVGSAYTAGYGLALTGTVFRADTAVLNGLVGIQRAITNNGAITNVSNITGLLANDLNFKWDATSYFSFTNATDPVLDIYMVGVPAGFGTSVSSFTEFAPDVITFGVDGPSSTFADLIANYDGGVSGSATLRAGRGGINFTVNAFSTGTAGATSVLTLQGTKSGATSSIDIYPDSLRLLPHLGQLSIDTLTNLSTQNTLLGWKQGSGQGQVGYITLGAGLSLASGVLTNTGLTATPGLQDVITEDPVLTTNNTIDAGSTLFKIKLDEDNDFTGFEGLNYGSIIGFQNGLALVKQGSGASSSSLQVVTGSSTLSSATAAATSNIVITPTSVSINPHLSNLLIDSLNYTLSTTRKKIMLRDTVTGLVENIDPALLSAASVSISGLTAATGTNTINNAALLQEWQWNTLAGGMGLYLSSTSTAATSNTQSLFASVLTGANANATQTTFAGSFGNAHTGTASTNVAGYFYAENGTTNIGGRFIAQGGTNNYAIIVPTASGSVGIGTSTPTSLLHVVPTNTTGIGAAFSSSSLTSGSLMDLTVTGTGALDNHRGLNVSVSGANAASTITSYGAVIANSRTGTSSINYGSLITASGGGNNNLGVGGSAQGGVTAIGVDAVASGATNNYGLRASASGGTVNAAIIVPAGNGSVGIGTSTPTEILDVVGKTKVSDTLFNAGNKYSVASTVVMAGYDTVSKAYVHQAIPTGGGGGNVTKVGTPVDNQIGVWTGDGTLEGDAEFLYDGTSLIFKPASNTAADIINMQFMRQSSNTTSAMTMGVDASDEIFFNSNAAAFYFKVSGTTKFKIPVSGGFNMNNPLAGYGTLTLGRSDASQTTLSFNDISNAAIAFYMGVTDANYQITGASANDAFFYSVGHNMQFSTNGTARMLSITPTELVVNDAGANYDFRAEGDTDPNNLISDAGEDKVFVGHSTSLGAYKFQVTGKGYFTDDVTVPDEAYAVGWNGSLEVPTKNAVYDKIEGLPTAQVLVIDQNVTAANNTGTGETDLHSISIATIMVNDEESVYGKFSGTFNDVTATSQIKLKFTNNATTTTIFDSGTLTVSATGGWSIDFTIIRTGNTTAKAIVNVSTPGASTSTYTVYTPITGLDLTLTGSVKATGQAGGASGGNNDITNEFTKIFWAAATVH